MCVIDVVIPVCVIDVRHNSSGSMRRDGAPGMQYRYRSYRTTIKAGQTFIRYINIIIYIKSYYH